MWETALSEEEDENKVRKNNLEHVEEVIKKHNWKSLNIVKPKTEDEKEETQ